MYSDSAAAADQAAAAILQDGIKLGIPLIYTGRPLLNCVKGPRVVFVLYLFIK